MTFCEQHQHRFLFGGQTNLGNPSADLANNVGVRRLFDVHTS
jgi:hypothetical protein